MSLAVDCLRELHQRLTLLAELRERLERAPRALESRRKVVVQLTSDLEQARDVVKQTRLAADKKQLDLKASEDRTENWRTQLNTAGSNQEYKTLQEQIAAAEMAASVLSDEILEMLERVDELESEASAAEQRLADGQKDLEEFASKIEETSATLRADIERIEGELAQDEKQLTGDFAGEYKRLVGRKGHEALASSEDGVCDGCGQKITLNMQNELTVSNKPVLCQSCGCLLYPIA